MLLKLKYIIIKRLKGCIVGRPQRRNYVEIIYLFVKDVRIPLIVSFESKMLDDNAEFIVSNHTFDDCIIVNQNDFVIE